MNIGTCINPPRRGLNHGKYGRKITIPIISVASGHDVESMVGKPKRKGSRQREIIRQTAVQFLYHELELPRATCLSTRGCGSLDDVASLDRREISKWGSPI